MKHVSPAMVELYKAHVEQIDRVRQGREGTNRVYLSLLSLCFAFIIFLFRFELDRNIEDPAMLDHAVVLIALLFLGFALSVSWLLHIRAYRQLNRYKFKMLHEFEVKYLPYSPLKREWEFQGEGRNLYKYTKLSNVAAVPPVLFAILFFFVLLIYLIA